MINCLAPDWKSNSQALTLPCTALSVKTLSNSFEIVTNVFEGAENLYLTLKSEIYIKKQPETNLFHLIF